MANILDGNLFAQMIISGANNLYNNKKKVDDLNVFPVPDGDTGTNMSLTAMAMAKELEAKTSASLTKTVDVMAFSTLRGARGNSGVILSQFFRGISKSLKGKEDCSAKEFAQALTDGAAAAYKAVMKPTEGTILTVAREAAAGAMEAAQENDGICEVLKGAVERGNKALERTPEQLPALKKAGVVDAGGQGWMFVLEGALYYLEKGKAVKNTKTETVSEKPQKAQAAVKTEDIKFKYCTEFIVEKYKSGASVKGFKNAISPKGDCMLVIDDDEVVKVHIHTNNPGFVLEEAVKLGEMINLKIDNMKHQHKSLIEENKTEKTEAGKAKPEKVEAEKREKAKKPEEIKDYGFVAIAAGKGFSIMLKDLGIDKIIEGGQTMNPSTDDILKAVKKVKAKTVYVFPNNKNIIMAAKQAAEITSDKQVIVIETRSIPECISSMMSFTPSRKPEENTNAMNKGLKKVHSASLTYAVRDTEIDDIEIKNGDILGINGSDITMVGKNTDEVLVKLTDSIVTEDTEYITLYYGKDIKKAAAEKVAKQLEEKYADDEIEVSLHNGGQPVYYYIIGVE